MTTEATVTEINRLLRGWTGRSDERRILQLLEECASDQLDQVLRQVNIRRVVRDLHNRVRGHQYRSRLLQLLTVDRLEYLSLKTRVDLVWALQRGSTRRTMEIAIRNVILASTGEELRELRNLLNLSGTHRDLPRLIFKDIDDRGIRAEIIKHIYLNKVTTSDVKVLSDIDDTLFARLHDRRYPGKTRYPGVLAFFRALNQAASDSGTQANITFVTARPGLFGGIVAAFTRKTLNAAGVPHLTILTGSLLALRNHQSMARRKIENIHQYHQVFPEYGLVFVGDSGQGDVQVGREMTLAFPESVRAVFIHDVKETALDEPARHDEPGITFFDTYIAAAAAAWQQGLITYEQAVEVGDAAIADLEELTLIPPPMRKDRLAEHQRDFDALRDMKKS